MESNTHTRRHALRTSVTIQDVAERAGVSTATVSRALAGSGVVSAKARARVLQAATETGYTPNVAARNLRARRSMMILVVVPNVANPFFPEVLRGVDDELVAAGYDMACALGPVRAAAQGPTMSGTSVTTRGVDSSTTIAQQPGSRSR